MKTIGPIVTKTRDSSHWRTLKHCFVEWRRRSRSRTELIGMGEADLRDFGASRCDAASEASKPFWMA